MKIKSKTAREVISLAVGAGILFGGIKANSYIQRAPEQASLCREYESIQKELTKPDTTLDYLTLIDFTRENRPAVHLNVSNLEARADSLTNKLQQLDEVITKEGREDYKKHVKHYTAGVALAALLGLIGYNISRESLE